MTTTLIDGFEFYLPTKPPASALATPPSPRSPVSASPAENTAPGGEPTRSPVRPRTVLRLGGIAVAVDATGRPVGAR